jgi:hypothetical protein
MHMLNPDVVTAFPAMLRQHALTVAAALPEPALPQARQILVKVNDEPIAIPYRLYYSSHEIKTDQFSAIEKELIHCLLTRHHNGYVRQQHLAHIVRSKNPWIPPFVVQLLGEYVIEIIQLIHDNLDALDHSLYQRFLRENPQFLAQTRQGVHSYWDCYYRGHDKSSYIGFKVLGFFEKVAMQDLQ